MGENLALAENLGRRLLPAALAALLFASCGGSSSTGPSAVQPPSILGTWTVTYSSVGSGSGVPSSSSRCPGNLSILAQSGGDFSGTMIITSPCAHASNVRGQMDANGVILSFVPSSRIGGLPTGCSVLSEPPLTGRLVGNALTVTSRDSYRCLGVDLVIDRTISATR